MTDLPRRIVLVEDNPGDVHLLRMALRQAGLVCDLRVLEDGAEAMRLARREAPYHDAVPDLIVLDLNLPKHDGLEVLAALRADPVLSAVPVVVFTSSTSSRERARVEALGAARFLAKPPDLDAFLAVGDVLRSMLR
ncbi:MAG TPA: response regulator [Candidatus Polarisedimenticolaceae bacterium]|nr:response regulator [Candidatus Polarisedimenticolaceae bacterium]